MMVVFRGIKMNGNTALPVAKFKAGQVSSAVWENQMNINGQNVTVLKCTVQRRYKDKSTGDWKSSGSFNRNEIALAIYCLQKALDKIVDIQNTASENNISNTEEILVD